MSNYILTSNDKPKTIYKLEVKHSYAFSPKDKKETYTKVKNIAIYDEKTINKIALKNALKKYKRIKMIMKNLLDSDDDNPGDYGMLLDEMNYFQGLLEYKYQKLLKKEAYELFIDNLMADRKLIEEKIYSLIEENSIQR